MPITEKQRARRRQHLGSSDVAAILGVHPYKSAADVYLDKTADFDETTDEAESPAMRIGSAVEDGVLAMAEQELGQIRRNQYRARPDLHLGANIDGIVVRTGDPVEAKTAGLLNPFAPLDDWGKDTSTELVPDHVAVQAHVHILCLGQPNAPASDLPSVCYVPALIGGRGFGLYRVTLSVELVRMIEDRAADWWTRHVVAATPPEIDPAGAGRVLETLKRVRREPQTTVAVDPVLVRAWREADAEAKQAEAKAKAAKAALLMAMQMEPDSDGRVLHAEAADSPDGDRITYLPQSRRGIDAKRLTEEQPDLIDKYRTLSTYRVLRYRKPKP
ncbi:MAG: YqaJ viral recombinase family protein [Planctomycetota bacterium]